MQTEKSLTLITISIIILLTFSYAIADITDYTKSIKISGGENHTLVLTNSGNVFGCGDNYDYQLGIGNTQQDQWTLVQVKEGDMNSPTEFLEDIDDISAGYTHSLALDVNQNVWAWGDNSYGQLGNNKIS